MQEEVQVGGSGNGGSRAYAWLMQGARQSMLDLQKLISIARLMGGAASVHSDHKNCFSVRWGGLAEDPAGGCEKLKART